MASAAHMKSTAGAGGAGAGAGNAGAASDGPAVHVHRRRSRRSDESFTALLAPEEQAGLPHTTKLLEQLGASRLGLLTPEGMSSDVHEDLQKARKKMEQSKRRYMAARLLYACAAPLLREPATGVAHDTTIAAASDTASAYQAAQLLDTPLPGTGSVGTSDSSAALHGAPVKSQRLLGLTRMEMMSQARGGGDASARRRAIQQRLIPQVEQRLGAMSAEVTEFLELSKPAQVMQDDSSSLISGFGAASTATSPTQSVLSAMTYDSTDPAAAILGLQAKQRALEDKVARKESALLEDQWRLFTTMGETLHTLNQMLRDHKLGSHHDYYATRVEFLNAAVTTGLQKLRHREELLLASLYNKNTVPALSTIRSLLDSRAAQLSEALARDEELLRRYQQVGMGFNELAAEYARVRALAAEKRQHLQQLKASTVI